MPKNKQVYVDSSEIHCKSNAVLSGQVIEYLKKNNHRITNSLKNADYIIINTCGFDQQHEDISFNIFDKVYKNKKEETKVFSIGCLNNIARKKLEDKFSLLKIVDDMSQLDTYLATIVIASKIKNAYYDKSIFSEIESKLNVDTVFTRIGIPFAKLFISFFGKFKYPRTDLLKKILNELTIENKVYVQIGSGCTGDCSYCIIKKARGKLQSRPIADILADIELTISHDKSLCLVADDCASYGVDIDENLFRLVDEINKKKPGIGIEFSYLSPEWITKYPDQYIDLFKNNNIKSANISLQSGSNKILNKMNRKYDIDNIIEIIKKIKMISPDTLLWTHIMVSFPTESWKDFYKSIKISGYFHYYNAFIYTPRKGTRSEKEFKTQDPFYISKIKQFILKSMLVIRLVKKIFIC
jgi:threonylcarbamoyladenosine tRNA methylthiotransferase CDKAL1